ncbi:cephalosporin-C deacetylase [Arthrobacter sp. AG258]|uniref:acetylxylan esterase n=1 Tax=Arthrobacter sp. AG258 TaxID=2183899 RepID=UPI00105E97A4|nr:acetylxylan esterase [Arthrobacter sp. AG258]TDT74666.1 cephalosporin-C deacetylase [Arthrobacter sp. AG258]
MPRFDLCLEELRSYNPTVREPEDFDAFWAATLKESRSVDRSPVVVPYDALLTGFDVFDVEFPGFAGDPVKAWFIVPAGTSSKLPTIVEFNGYGGGRGLPQERLVWPAAGYAYFFMDTRGQGSAWGSGGETADPFGAGPASPGFMTKGIEHPSSYYYRRVFTDAVRAIDAVRTFEQVDSERISVAGASQGGGIALAAAGLAEGLVAVMPDVPFLCHFERAVAMTDADPYNEIVRYLSVHRHLADRAFHTLSYFDGVSFAARSSAPSLFSVGLLDPVCPPSTVFAAHNNYKAPSNIEVYPYNEHEGGQAHHWRKQATWLAETLGNVAR